ncbi:MAG: amidophosphoribosyltransferase, partial [Pseudomonadota bacterium]
ETSKLLASRMTIDEMRDYIKVDSLAFLSIDGLYKAVSEPGRNDACPQFCDACFTGDYPTALTDRDGTDQTRRLSLLAKHG